MMEIVRLFCHLLLLFEIYLPMPPLSENEQRVREYLAQRNIKELFHLLQSSLLSEEPENPYARLVEWLDQLISFREGHGEPPLLFTPKHVEAVFSVMDPVNTGRINIEQYKNGMMTMGLTEYDQSPTLDEWGFVTREFAADEANKRLKDQMRKIVTYEIHRPTPEPIKEVMDNICSDCRIERDQPGCMVDDPARFTQ